MTGEFDVDRATEELDQLLKNLPRHNCEQDMTPTEVDEFFKDLDQLPIEACKPKFQMPKEVQIALQKIEIRQNRQELKRLLREAAALAKRIGAPEAESFVASALASIPAWVDGRSQSRHHFRNSALFAQNPVTIERASRGR